MGKQLSPILMELRRIFAEGIRRIDNDECSEAYAIGMISKFNAESKGYINDDSVVNYDEAMRITGIRQREKLLSVCKRYNIKQQKINNQSVGFLKSEIECLATTLRKPKEDGAE